MDYHSLIWGLEVTSTIDEPWGAFTCRSSILAVFVDCSTFHGLLFTVFWSQNDFQGCRTPRCAYVLVVKTRSLGRFSPVSWTINQRFGVLEPFPRLTIPRMRLRVRRQHSQFWPILTRFVDYYTPIWGPKAISKVVEPQGALTCQSSTLTVLVDSRSFRGLLLTVLGPQSDLHYYQTPGCVYVSVINAHSFGRFWPVSCTITHCFGSRSDFHD